MHKTVKKWPNNYRISKHNDQELFKRNSIEPKRNFLNDNYNESQKNNVNKSN